MGSWPAAAQRCRALPPPLNGTLLVDTPAAPAEGHPRLNRSAIGYSRGVHPLLPPPPAKLPASLSPIYYHTAIARTSIFPPHASRGAVGKATAPAQSQARSGHSRHGGAAQFLTGFSLIVQGWRATDNHSGTGEAKTVSARVHATLRQLRLAGFADGGGGGLHAVVRAAQVDMALPLRIGLREVGATVYAAGLATRGGGHRDA